MEILTKLDRLALICKASVSVTYNEHTTSYETVEQYIDYMIDHDLIDEKPADYDEMVKRNLVIEVHFYPRTPVGFYHLVGCDLEKLLDEAIEIAKKEVA